MLFVSLVFLMLASQLMPEPRGLPFEPWVAAPSPKKVCGFRAKELELRSLRIYMSGGYSR